MRYLKSVARGGKRFDLNGKPAGDVTAEEKAAAAKFVQTSKTAKSHKPQPQQKKWLLSS
ncbi:ProQ/FINO family protein [Iodobacter fluviatilis]|uniref:ProQ/FINO family protein n=1 Tax=Iodobacter fluviatilis TaxID=537 RepID=UPI0035709E8A